MLYDARERFCEIDLKALSISRTLSRFWTGAKNKSIPNLNKILRGKEWVPERVAGRRLENEKNLLRAGRRAIKLS
jgi:hypothetical protein